MSNIDSILEKASLLHPGPGGAIAIVKDEVLLGQRAWGFADLNQRIPVTKETPIPVCSITKQMVCAILHTLKDNPTPSMPANEPVSVQLETNLKEMLGREFCDINKLSIQLLCDNQSGIRDYWATNTLLGAKPDDHFSLETDARPMISRIRSVHFTPGTEFSYSNTNFHILARIAERTSGQSLSKLLRERLFRPAGMATAVLCPSTEHQPGACVGYEGGLKEGYFPARNRIEWSGDAGVVASLNDMIAYEIYLQRIIRDSKSWYHQHSKHGTFSDGNKSFYSNGLFFGELDGTVLIGHGGAIRGYRISRNHIPSQGLSVVVMLNHEADADKISRFVLQEVLAISKVPTHTIAPTNPWHFEVGGEWTGNFLDLDTFLSIRAKITGEKTVSISYAGEEEEIQLHESRKGISQDIRAEIDGDFLSVHRLRDNRDLDGIRLHPNQASRRDPSIPGVYECTELDSTFTCFGQGEVLYGAFDGALGRGPASPMTYLGDNVWVLACARGQDADAPGDWTLVFDRVDPQSGISRVTIGCWLARKFAYLKREME
ncbi:unnamed protein product [Clonostachys rosea]|uniref:Beta-lactamase-related domain-containing protein n=1 Tax=Bionectria ochroleuca TaxID=29856 RepID=A0ABY6UKX6_BIOOC|nr:unnamed protein product [Clonostachys rosea]